MTDQDIQDRIEALEAEEQRLRADEGARSGQGDDAQLAEDRRKLEELRVQLDQQWDLLRRRRALRDAGRNPDDAELRDPGTVENYLG
jgi:hypothetical protein